MSRNYMSPKRLAKIGITAGFLRTWCQELRVPAGGYHLLSLGHFLGQQSAHDTGKFVQIFFAAERHAQLKSIALNRSSEPFLSFR